MPQKGLLVIISGPSGAGKGTISKSFIEKNDCWISVSATTRQPRTGERQGINYFFMSREEFEIKIADNDFLEYAEVYGNLYGTPKSTVEDVLNSGKDVILEIDIQGAMQVKERVKEGVFIFIMPPSMEELKQRIIKRGSETPESLSKRFASAFEEMNFISKYDYAVVNDIVDLAVKKVESIIIAEKCRVGRIVENNVHIK